MRDYPSELRADFQQTYGLNLDGMGEEYSYIHAADLAAQLPSNSRTFVAIDPKNLWTLDARILALIEFRANVIGYYLRRGTGEKPRVLFEDRRSNSGIEPMTVDEVKEFLSRSRT